ncbi:hypothetical protein Taro_035005 [Colocasia esculenta]|uniref:Uncharacterized protein n=1 Tax=Colocasia esculenta TaxID=4460 RepID=A0A843WHA6_COLES|nr:hypothetical protein [Colocasia esculenta]
MGSRKLVRDLLLSKELHLFHRRRQPGYCAGMWQIGLLFHGRIRPLLRTNLSPTISVHSIVMIPLFLLFAPVMGFGR